MPDLKDLGFAVQEKVAAPDFDQILRRGRRRRSRDQVLMVAAAAATAAVVAAVAVSPVILSRGQNEQNPASPADAELRAFLMTAPDQWVASWEDCTPLPCRHTAKVQRGSRQASTTAEVDYVSALRYVDPASSQSTAEPVGLVGARMSRDVWPGLFRLTPGGPLARQLRQTSETWTIGPGEILTDDVQRGLLYVVNVQAATARYLHLPAQLMGGRGPVRDGTGRWWILSGSIANERAWVAWTDDGGRNWTRRELTHGDVTARLAVSPDGKTAVVIANGRPDPSHRAIWLSRDRGQTWKSLKDRPWTMEGGPVVFDDGTVLLLGRFEHDDELSVYWIERNGTTANGPTSLTSLASVGDLVYGMTDKNTVQVSRDRFQTWTEFQPR